MAQDSEVLARSTTGEGGRIAITAPELIRVTTSDLETNGPEGGTLELSGDTILLQGLPDNRTHVGSINGGSNTFRTNNLNVGPDVVVDPPPIVVPF